MISLVDFAEYREQIVSLWCSVFKEDSREDAEFFIDNIKHSVCLGYFSDEKLVSMLFLVDCKYSDLKGRYVYAVCTAEEFRRKGFSTCLIEKAKEYMNDFLWLIPANDSLFGFYKKTGFEMKLFSDKSYENRIEFNESDEIIDYLYSGSDYDFPKGMVYSVKNFPVGSTGLKR